MLNPYQDADWSDDSRRRTNLHTHTTESDGGQNPDAVIDEYLNKGYEILAITDHNAFTWPWTDWDRDPDQLDIMAIAGCEASRHDHTNTFFINYDGAYSDMEQTLQEVTDQDGLSQINHPGRYERGVDFYVDLLQTYDHIMSLEVYNQGDRYSGDRDLWDGVLTELMSDRPIWATSNDDSHSSGHIGRNYQMMLIPGEVNEESFRNTYQTGRFYTCFDMTGTGENTAHPDSVVVNGGEITVYPASLGNDVRWISNGQEVHQGPTLSLMETEDLGNYVRAVIHGTDDAMTLIQPFGLKDSVVVAVGMARMATYQISSKRISPAQYRFTTAMDISAEASLLDLRGRVKFRGRLSPEQPFVIDHPSGRVTPYILRLQMADATKSILLVLD
jgi:hypothetical protein